MVKSSRTQAKAMPMDVVKPTGVVKTSRKRPEMTVVKPAHNKRSGGNRGAAAAVRVPESAGRVKHSLGRPGPNDVVNSKFNTFHLKHRRSSRPIKPKGNKSARVAGEGEATAKAKAADEARWVGERRRLLTKLLARHKAAGRMDAVAETQAQLDELAISAM